MFACSQCLFCQSIMGMHGRGNGYCINLLVLKHLVNVLSTADAWIQGSDLFTTISLNIAAHDELTFRQGAEISHKVGAPITQSNNSQLYCHNQPPLNQSTRNSFIHFASWIDGSFKASFTSGY